MDDIQETPAEETTATTNDVVASAEATTVTTTESASENTSETVVAKFQVGDTIAVHHKIKEGEKTRVQIFEGIVLAMKNAGDGRSFTIRKIAAGNIGVERIWSLNNPWIEKIVIKRHPRKKIKRAKLYHLRDLTPKEVQKKLA